MNNAKYGSDYASYPYELRLVSSYDSWKTLVSGQTFKDIVYVGIYDQNGQLVTTDSESEALLTTNDL